MAAHNPDARITEYDLSMAHGDISANLDDAVELDKTIERIYQTWPSTFEQIEILRRILSRMVLRNNRARSFLARELKKGTMKS